MQTYRWQLDLQMFNQEKTEKATPKKRQETRQKGQVAKTVELPGALILLFAFLSFFLLGGFYKERLLHLFGDLLQDWLTMELSAGNVMSLAYQVMMEVGLMLAPIFAIAVVVAIVANLIQFGFLLSGEPLKMKLNKLNPINGLKQIFSVRSLVEFVKSVLKLIVIGLLVFWTISSEWKRMLSLSFLSVEEIFGFAASLTLRLGLQIGAVLFVLAVLDYLYQRYEYEKSIRMSKQDIKDEFKKTEGNPLIKGRIREQQRKMALRRMMQEIPKADVVITNPTHFAVALRYDASEMEAPVVVAKGMDYVALRIKEIAKEHGVVTMENKPLARALYDRTDIGDMIPGDLFQAVAEVLAYVYKIKGRVKSS
ncbi:flagellar biosynthesis protein FlhB [Paenibacillus cisolokensis]|jgi:flagellar biosynthetic protein FlhB|uniref:flagellar biosynthesis protein FlhB n=1 Tax=Paenibacillus cisolokensis TaxID=1658519 RepID=UPI003D27DCA6